LSLEEVEASTPGSRSIRGREEEEDFAIQDLASSNSKSWRERFHCYTARHLRLPFYNECEEKVRTMYHELRHLGEGRTVCSALCAEREQIPIVHSLLVDSREYSDKPAQRILHILCRRGHSTANWHSNMCQHGPSGSYSCGKSDLPSTSGHGVRSIHSS
jgi:hypothetical protein